MIKRRLANIVRKHGHDKRSSSTEDIHQGSESASGTSRRTGSVNSTADYEELSADMIPEEEKIPSRPIDFGPNFIPDSNSTSNSGDSKRHPMTSTNTSKCSTDDSVVKDSVATNVSVNSSPVTSAHSHRKSNHSPPSVSNNVTPANSCQSVPISPAIKVDVISNTTSGAFSPISHSTPSVSASVHNGSGVVVLPPPSCSKEHNGKSSKSGSDSKKKKSSAWYNVLSPTYKSKSEDFKRIFKDVPNEERLIIDYSCALQKDILIQGRLYVSQNFICFYANIFRWETVLTIRIDDITSITKERTARVIPNAIQIATAEDKFFFSSFGARDKTHIVLFRLWHNCLLDQPLSTNDQWRWVHYNYGDDLHLTSSDDDYIAAPYLLDKKHNRKLPFSPNGSAAGMAVSGDLPERSESAGELPDKDGWLTSSLHNLPPSDIREAETDSTKTAAEPTDQASENPAAIKLSNDDLLKVPDIKKGHLDASTDPGNTSTDDDDEVLCEGHAHKDIRCIDEVFDMSVNDLYSRLFTNSIMYQRFMQSRNTSDLVISEWTEPDNHGVRTRELTYTLSLSHAIGPNFSYSTEKQTCHSFSTPGSNYMIDAEFNNTGIPYGDSFFVINRYCLNRVNSRQSRLRITAEINFRKKPFGLVKNYIQKTATHGILDNFATLGEHLREECLEISGETASKIPSISLGSTSTAPVTLNPPLVPMIRKRCLRKKRFPSVDPSRQPVAVEATPTVENSTKQFFAKSSIIQSETPTDQFTLTFNIYTLTRLLIFIMISMLLFNGLIYMKMNSLENQAASLVHQSLDDPMYFNQKVKRTNDEWQLILKKQRSLYSEDMSRWREKLSLTLQQLDSARETILVLSNRVKHIADTLNSNHQESKPT